MKPSFVYYTCNGTPKLPSSQIPRLKKLIKYAESNNAETARLLKLQCKVRGFLNQISTKESDVTVNNKVNDSDNSLDPAYDWVPTFVQEKEKNKEIIK